MERPLTEPMKRAIRRALSRGGDYPLCPTFQVHAAAQEALIAALERRGLVEYTPAVRGRPRLTPAGAEVGRDLLRAWERERAVGA